MGHARSDNDVSLDKLGMVTFEQASSDEADDSSVVSEEGHLSDADLPHSTPAGKSQEMDTPEVLVRRENQAVRITGIVVLVVLLAAASLTSFLTYRFTRDAETASFRDSFADIGNKITEGMLSETLLKFWTARTVASVITLQMDSMGTDKMNVTVKQENFDTVCQEALYKGGASSVSWTPILKNDLERRHFETVVQGQAGSDPSAAATIPCYICGSPTRGFARRDQLHSVQGFGTFKCGDIEKYALGGLIPAAVCPALTAEVAEPCGCTDLEPDELLGVTPTQTGNYEIPPYIFTVDNNTGAAVVEPYGQRMYAPIRLESANVFVQPGLMFDTMSFPPFERALNNMVETKMPGLSETYRTKHPYFVQYPGRGESDIDVSLFYPVMAPNSTDVVGAIRFALLWDGFVQLVFPPGSQNVRVVIENSW